jgi:hypothetical protein
LEEEMICSGMGFVEKKEESSKNFNYVLKNSNLPSRQFFGGTSKEEEEFLFDSLNSMAYQDMKKKHSMK